MDTLPAISEWHSRFKRWEIRLRSLERLLACFIIFQQESQVMGCKTQTELRSFADMRSGSPFNGWQK